MGSNFCRQKPVSDDDEIDYSVKPEFYDPELNDKDELWVQKKRGGRTSDAILNCPACFTTLCLDYQSSSVIGELFNQESALVHFVTNARKECYAVPSNVCGQLQDQE
uniref:E2F-associated phosphoprotein isoform X2 n=1 Tax=Nicotiana tabacum TaxID=4097 RepID=A0A1S4BH50_TOBAC|nr:PREDICTED: E2F-associated phosphoprotein-like isoform X2 [Nicotiana tabacum]